MFQLSELFRLSLFSQARVSILSETEQDLGGQSLWLLANSFLSVFAFVCLHVHVCGGPWSLLGVFLGHTPLFFLIERGSLTEFGGSSNLVGLLASESQDLTYLCPRKHWGYRHYATWYLNVGIEILNQGSHACTTRTSLSHFPASFAFATTLPFISSALACLFYYKASCPWLFLVVAKTSFSSFC